MDEINNDAAPVRICPRCSTQSETAGEHCPHCGASFVRGRKPWSKRRKRIAAVVAGILVLGGGTAGIVAKVSHDDQVAEDKAEAKAAADRAAAAERAAEKAAQAKKDAQEAEDKLEREIRKIGVQGMRKSITKDAKSRVAEGVLEGPILGTQCDPVGGGSVDNLGAKTTKFECLAINEKNGDGTVSGYTFNATMNWDTGSYTWRLGG